MTGQLTNLLAGWAACAAFDRARHLHARSPRLQVTASDRPHGIKALLPRAVPLMTARSQLLSVC